MKKNKVLAIGCSLALTAGIVAPIQAEDYSDEAAWYEKCTKPQTSQEGVKACQGFQAHQQQKKEQLQNSISQFNKDIASLESDTTKMEALAQQQKKLADSLNGQIEEKQKLIDQIKSEIDKLYDQIEEKQKDIDKWDAQIRTRMQSEQTNVGTNTMIDLLMGARNLNDMLRRLTGIERITEQDQDQIDILNTMKKELELQKSEQERLKKDAQAKKEELIEQQNQYKELEASYNQLVKEYQKQIADLQAQKRSAAADMGSIQSFVITEGSFDSGNFTPTAGMMNPIPSGGISEGTWSYSSGGLHLGLDWAAPIGTPVLAPANGVIIYANNPAPTNGGYLGNWAGWPYGGGNTIAMLCQVNGTLYSVSFAHLAQHGFAVSAGSSVSQGQQIALTGNSGNSSGPHCHIEVINLGSMSIDDAIARFSGNADFAWGTGWNSTSTSCEAGYPTPCRERPERFFG